MVPVGAGWQAAVILESMLAGLVAGALGSLVGLGGGLFLVPFLSLVLGLPLKEAIPASLVGVVATAIGGTGMFLRDGHADSRLAIRVGGLAMAGAMLGAKLNVFIAANVLSVGFAVLLVVIAAQMARQRRPVEDGEAGSSPWAAGGMIAGAGVLSGLLGVGGGVMNVPALHLAFRRGMVQAVATSTLIIAFTAAAAAASYASAGYVRWDIAAGCATGAFAGGRLGAFLATRLPRTTLTWVFVVILLYVAMEMGVKGLGLPWWR